MPLVSVRPNNVYKGDIFEELLAKVDVVAVDLDGTLLNARADVDDLTASAIRRASAAGIRVIPATGRVLSVLPETLTAIQDIEYAVCCAGATVLRMDESRDCCFALKDDGFEPNEAAEIVGMIIHRYHGDVLVDFSCEGVMYSERSMLAELESFDVPGLSIAYVRRSRRQVDDLVHAASLASAPVGRINIFARDERMRLEIMSTLSEERSYELGNSLKHNIEINPEGTSKWRGLTWLCDHLGISRDHIMAVGDSSNDIDMLSRAWVGVAMKNASRDALAAADARTVWANDESGVARLLTEMVDIRQSHL